LLLIGFLDFFVRVCSFALVGFLLFLRRASFLLVGFFFLDIGEGYHQGLQRVKRVDPAIDDAALERLFGSTPIWSDRGDGKPTGA